MLLSPISVLAADDEGRHLATNRAACAWTGYSERELLEINVRSLWARQIRRVDSRWRRFLVESRFEGACQIRRKTGELVRVECVGIANVIAGIHFGAMASAGLLRHLGDRPLNTLR